MRPKGEGRHKRQSRLTEYGSLPLTKARVKGLTRFEVLDPCKIAWVQNLYEIYCNMGTKRYKKNNQTYSI